MELWFTEEHSEDVRFSIRIVRQLFSKRSKFQQIDIFDSKEFGKVLVLDDSIVITEKDEFIYHEMMVHVACAANPDLRKVLVIGGSNGGCVRELIKYPFIEKIDVVEADDELIKACKVHFPKITKSFDDPRVSVIVSDGLKFVRKLNKVYDLILVDSTDPFGPNETFFTREFYGNCFTALTPSGNLGDPTGIAILSANGRGHGSGRYPHERTLWDPETVSGSDPVLSVGSLALLICQQGCPSHQGFGQDLLERAESQDTLLQ